MYFLTRQVYAKVRTVQTLVAWQPAISVTRQSQCIRVLPPIPTRLPSALAMSPVDWQVPEPGSLRMWLKDVDIQSSGQYALSRPRKSPRIRWRVGQFGTHSSENDVEQHSNKQSLVRFIVIPRICFLRGKSLPHNEVGGGLTRRRTAHPCYPYSMGLKYPWVSHNLVGSVARRNHPLGLKISFLCYPHLCLVK